MSASTEPYSALTLDSNSGLELLDIPVLFGDPRISGRLTIASNGTGRDFADGRDRTESRTCRIEDADGSRAGEGERVLATDVHEPRPLIDPVGYERRRPGSDC